MNSLIDQIINKNYDAANASLKEELSSIVERKLGEIKKQKAAKIETKPPFEPDVKAPKKRIKAVRKSIQAQTKVVSEAMVDRDGLVSLPTGERVLASVYRQRRWLAENCGLDKDKEEKIHDALEKAKMLLHPKLDTTAPRVDRTKVVRPKGGHARVDKSPILDLGPKEDEWMHGKELKKGSEQVDEGLKKWYNNNLNSAFKKSDKEGNWDWNLGDYSEKGKSELTTGEKIAYKIDSVARKAEGAVKPIKNAIRKLAKEESEQVNENIKEKIVQKVNDLMNLRSDRRDQEKIREIDKQNKKKPPAKYGVKSRSKAGLPKAKLQGRKGSLQRVRPTQKLGTSVPNVYEEFDE